MAVVYWLHKPEHTDIFTEGYVGVTVKTAEERYRQHELDAKRGSHLAVHRAIRKYGSLIVDTVVVASEEYCYMVEGKLRSKPSTGYNAAIGGNVSPTTGVSPSEETRRKIARKGKDHWAYGKKHSEETCRKKSERMRGENNHMFGKTLSEETRAKIAEASRNRVITEEARKNYSKATSGENNVMYGRSAWLHPRANLTVWSQAVRLFELFSSFKKCGNQRLSMASGLPRDSLEKIVEKFRSGWNPNEDPDYLSWLANFNNKEANSAETTLS